MKQTDLLAGEIVQRSDKLVAWRDDRRDPEVTFGRCALTGEFGSVIALDLGDISIEAPDTSKGVTLGEDGSARFDHWRPVLFHNTATFGERGLEMLLDYLRNSDSPIPAITPDLQYGWQVYYKDGSGLSQFEIVDGEPVEVNSKEINKSEIAQLSLTGHYDPAMPVYTFVKETGKFYKNGTEIDTGYDGSYDQSYETIYARSTSHHYGSVTLTAGRRSISNAHTVVLYLIGWKENGLTATDGKAHVIAVDERGQWRGWEFRE